MTFCSYAQNFEDVLLWRALRSLATGFYIDVGAAHPDEDSVTRAFYDRGWRGINIEPVPELFGRLRAARSRDVTLNVALAAAAGETSFHVVSESGLSTLDGSIAGAHREAGFAVRETRIEVSTLASVCEAHAAADIHFLKIDVEGAEGAVLRGADFGRFRPWIVIVEATAPLSSVPAHEDWEPILLEAGYSFLYFDGLNRFYAADEHFDALVPHFRIPVNVFDDFIRAADLPGARRLAELELQVGSLMEQSFAGEAALTEAVRREAQAEQRAGASERQTEAADARTAQAEQRLVVQAGEHNRTLAALKHAQEDAASLRASTSWRVTAPLRRFITISRAAPRAWRMRRLPEHAGTQLQQALLAIPGETPALPPPSHLASVACRPTRTVHQFHAGSGYGDAITNAMLLIRAWLRGMGYRSDIFVVHRDEALRDELRTADELPVHGGYVLLFHHSMGFDGYERVAELPAPKILIYHNITPVEFFDGKPDIQRYIHIGRQQLADLRGRVVAALADSPYNTIELHRMGFANPRACTLLFDLDGLRRRFGGARDRSPRPFTVLFVGRVVAAKGQLDLVEAFARLPAPSRLVIVGREDGAGDDYARAVRLRIRALGIEDRATLTGLVSDDALQGHYRAADLYVSLSQHEGFGVPLVEAAVAGIPVLAWPAGAVAYTLGGGDGLLASRDPAAVAARMRALMHDEAARRALVAFQAQALAQYRLDDHLDILRGALTLAGAAPVAVADGRDALRGNLRFDVAGHVNGTYSLAAINRTIARAIEIVRPGSVRLVPVEGQPTGLVDNVPNGERPGIAALASRPPHPTGPVAVISQHYPVYVPERRGDCLLAYIFWEETLLPSETVRLLNEKFDGVLAPTRFVANALINSGVGIPVHPVGYAPELGNFEALGRRERAARAEHVPFTFLHISSAFPRKGVDVLLAAYTRACRAGDPVRLVIKAFPNPHNDIAEQIARLRAADAALPDIELIDRDMSSHELMGLYETADAMVLPTRGEGFNLPAAEAMAAGIPLIVTGFGGHMDFCSAANARLLRYRLAPSGSHVATGTSLWAEPDVDDLAQAMGEVLREPEAASRRAGVAQDVAAQLSVPGPFVRRVQDAALTVLQTPPRGTLRVAMITTFAVRCGIAEYARLLGDGMMQAEPGLHLTMLADTRAAARNGGAQPAVRAVWPLNADEAIEAARLACAAEDPDAVIVQHQPGLLPWITLGCMVTALQAAERVVLVTLHNTAHLLEIPEPERAAAISGLKQASRILVHSVADVNRLAELGLIDNVALIPHGAVLPLARNEERSLAPRDVVTIGSYGFLLRDKGVPQLVAAAAILKPRWPKLRLRLFHADYGNDESRSELAAAQSAARRGGLSGAFELVTDFLPDAESRAHLAQCDVVVLPYQRSKEGASGALRMALSAGGVVAVTPIALFDEAGESVVRLPGTSPEAIADGLDAIFSDRAVRVRAREAAARWMAERSWASTGERVLGMIRGLLSSPA